MKEETKKKILFIMICIITIIILFGALRINENRKNNLLNQSYINGTLTEIKYDEIKNHIVEQPNTVIYVSNSGDNNSTNFEKNFKSVVKKYNLENNIIYINIHDTNIADPVYQNAPEIVVYKAKEVSEVIDATTLKSNNDIIKALKERGLLND